MSDSNASNPYYDPNSPPSCAYWTWECDNLSFWKNPVDKATACSMVAFSCGGSEGALPPGGRPPSITPPGQTSTTTTTTPSTPDADKTTTVVAPVTTSAPPSGMSTTSKVVVAAAIGGALYLAYRAMKTERDAWF